MERWPWGAMWLFRSRRGCEGGRSGTPQIPRRVKRWDRPCRSFSHLNVPAPYRSPHDPPITGSYCPGNAEGFRPASMPPYARNRFYLHTASCLPIFTPMLPLRQQLCVAAIQDRQHTACGDAGGQGDIGSTLLYGGGVGVRAHVCWKIVCGTIAANMQCTTTKRAT